MKVCAEGKTKSGKSYVIRTPELVDVESAHRYVNRISQERTFISFQGEEVSLEDEQRFIESAIQKQREGKGIKLFLVVEGEVMGISSIELMVRSESHVGIFAISIDQSLRGEGLGRKLMETVIEQAEKLLTDMHIIKLTVKAPNQVARDLYIKLGFKEYGLLPEGTRQNDELVDEVLMYKPVVR